MNRQAKYILAIADEGSISRAAEKLFISQPSLSQVLINTEKKYGVKLFVRNAHSLSLTEAGETFVNSMREIVQIERMLVQHLQEQNDSISGKLLVGMSVIKSAYLLPHILPKFQAAFPKVEVNLMEGLSSFLETALLKKQLDLAVINYSYEHPDLTYVPLPEDELLLVASIDHPLARRYRTNCKQPIGISIKELANEPFIYLSPKHAIHGLVEHLFQSHNIFPPKAFETSNSATAYALATAGVGLTIISEKVIRHTVKERPCVTFSIKDAAFRRKTALCYPKSYHPISKAMAHIITLTQDALQDMNDPT